MSEASLDDAFQTPIERRVEFYDQTLRDGEQTAGVAFSSEEKMELARTIDDLGVDLMNVGFPAVSEAEARVCRTIAELDLQCQTVALSRLRKEDIDVVADVGVDWIALFVPTSDTHLRHKLRLSEEEAVRRVQWCIRYARDKGLIPLLGLEDGTRTPLDRLRRVVDAAQEAGVSSLELSDTVGVLTPSATQRCIEWMRPLVDCTLRVHFHNDLGMATANTLTALEAGADGAHVTLAGLGERAGNTPLEEVAVALAVRYGADTKIRLDRLVPAATLVAKYAGVDLGRQRPIVGADVFSHESGIHVAGLLAEPSTYEPFPPSLLGREHHIVFGKHSGITGLRHVLAPTGYTLSEEAERALLNRLKTDATRYKRPISSEEVVRLARDMASNRDS